MKRVHNLLVFLTLFTSIATLAMDCGICYEPISIIRPSVSICSNHACAQANLICKGCLNAWLQKNQLCPYGCGSNLKINPSKPFSFSISRDQKIVALGALSVATLPWIAQYWSEYRLLSTLHAIKTAAHVKTETLLSFEFDCDNGTFLSLQESFDSNQLLSGLQTERERIMLKGAIEQYDIALNNAYARIISTYYYQPANHFEQKESALVQELRKCTEEIDRLITSYTQKLGKPLRNLLLSVGVGMLSGIGILYNI